MSPQGCWRPPDEGRVGPLIDFVCLLVSIWETWSGPPVRPGLPDSSRCTLGDLVEATCQARSPECMSVAWRLRHRRCCLLELGCRSQRIFCVWLHCQSVLLGTRDPQRGTREPTCSVFFFFHGLPPPWGTPWPICLSLSFSLSLAAAAARPPAFACHLPAAACRPLPPFFPKKEWDLP